MPTETEIIRPLLDWLLLQFPDSPRTRAKEWIQSGRVQVGDQIVRKPQERMPNPGEGLKLLEKGAESLACGAGWEIHPRVTLIHLDGSLAILNKGAGLVSVPAANNPISALSVLADFLAGRLKALAAGRTVPARYRKLEPLPVHRLDEYTSGLFCAAMSPNARQRLITELEAGHITREYVAFADGRLAHREGTWRHWLELDDHRYHQHVIAPPAGSTTANAREAITHFTVLEEFSAPGGKGVITKLRLTLETGLKHQIRIQAAEAGVPLIGDRRYHPSYREYGRSAVPVPFSRQALHAARLSLEHPDRRQRMTWMAPLPEDLAELERALRAGRSPVIR